MQKEQKQPKNYKEYKDYLQNVRDLINMGMKSLFVKPQAQEQSNKVPTKRLGAGPLYSPYPQMYGYFAPTN